MSGAELAVVGWLAFTWVIVILVLIGLIHDINSLPWRNRITKAMLAKRFPRTRAPTS